MSRATAFLVAEVGHESLFSQGKEVRRIRPADRSTFLVAYHPCTRQSVAGLFDLARLAGYALRSTCTSRSAGVGLTPSNLLDQRDGCAVWFIEQLNHTLSCAASSLNQADLWSNSACGGLSRLSSLNPVLALWFKYRSIYAILVSVDRPAPNG
jgi:hypothetical protein